MKYVFFGTDNFSVAILEKLISEFYHPSLVITMPDRPVGRKQILTPPPIKEVCLDHDIPFAQPTNLDEIRDTVSTIKPEVFIVASYGKIIPEDLLQIPSIAPINVHTSLLPNYRGSSPIQNAILHGEEETGVSIMKMDQKMDHGPVYFRRSVPISENETYRSLHAKLAHVGAETLTKVLPDILEGKMQAEPQIHSEATYTKMITKNDAKIDWAMPAAEIERMVRAYYDWPIAWTLLPDGKRLKIISATASEKPRKEKPGMLSFSDEQVQISTSKGVLFPLEMQVEGKGIVDAQSFMAGYQRFANQQLG
jgi:methionyl-tRNA formyltransferase